MKNKLFDELTNKEEEVANLVRRGLTNQEIANLLGNKLDTIKSHVKKSCKKLHVSGRTELAGLAKWHRHEPDNLKLDINSPINEISHSIDGIWLSKFEYKAHRMGTFIEGIQYDLEYLKNNSTKTDVISFTGENLFCQNYSQVEYFHQLECNLLRNNLIGIWTNKNTKNVGCFQLYIHNNSHIMLGKHLGNANDNSIQVGNWYWIKVEMKGIVPNSISQLKDTLTMIEFEQLNTNFNQWFTYAHPIDIGVITRRKRLEEDDCDST